MEPSASIVEGAAGTKTILDGGGVTSLKMIGPVLVIPFVTMLKNSDWPDMVFPSRTQVARARTLPIVEGIFGSDQLPFCET